MCLTAGTAGTKRKETLTLVRKDTEIYIVMRRHSCSDCMTSVMDFHGGFSSQYLHTHMFPKVDTSQGGHNHYYISPFYGLYLRYTYSPLSPLNALKSREIVD